MVRTIVQGVNMTRAAPSSEPLDFSNTDPAVSAKLRERYGDNIPFGDPVISPIAMFRSTLLVTVAER
jgi:hypothetical protein